jgi:hypothetical protein
MLTLFFPAGVEAADEAGWDSNAAISSSRSSGTNRRRRRSAAMGGGGERLGS